jgi:hypothetical protein
LTVLKFICYYDNIYNYNMVYSLSKRNFFKEIQFLKRKSFFRNWISYTFIIKFDNNGIGNPISKKGSHFLEIVFP